MKKLLSIAICATAIAAVATDTVIEVGSVDVTEVSASLNNTIIASSYLDMGGVNSVAVSNLVDTSNLATGTQLALFDGSQYETWTLTAGSGNNYWQKNSTKYTVNASGELVVGTGSGSSTTVEVGKGIWIIQSGTVNNVYLYGKASSTKSITVSGKTLVGNPTQTAQAPTISSPNNGDQVLVPASSGTLYGMKIYTYSSNKKGWVTTTGGIPGTASLPSIDQGKGFWYSGSATISWN